jgi:hypothetical protein
MVADRDLCRLIAGARSGLGCLRGGLLEGRTPSRPRGTGRTSRGFERLRLSAASPSSGGDEGRRRRSSMCDPVPSCNPVRRPVSRSKAASRGIPLAARTPNGCGSPGELRPTLSFAHRLRRETTRPQVGRCPPGQPQARGMALVLVACGGRERPPSRAKRWRSFLSLAVAESALPCCACLPAPGFGCRTFLLPSW